MKLVEDERAKNIYGVGQVKVLTSLIKVNLLGRDGKSVVDEFQFDKEDVECVVRKGKFRVAISGDGNILYGIYPSNGTFTCKFSHFAAPSDQPPAPLRSQGTGRKKDGTTYEYDDLVFRAICPIQDGPDVGMEIPVRMFYDKFISDDDGYTAVKKGGTRSEFLVDFLEGTGAWDLQLKFSENILPELEDTIRKKRKQFTLVVKNGWAQSIGPALSIGRTVRKKRKAKKKK